jgi:hypothetical protein
MELGGSNVPRFTTYTPRSWVEKSTTFQITKQVVKQQQGAWGVGSKKNSDDVATTITKTTTCNSK